jgi:hypothetical protein
VVMVSAEEVVTVKSADSMSDSDFERHMNMRHHDSLGNLGRVDFAHTTAYVIHCWRMFHKSIHRIRVGINHEHAAYQGGGNEQQEDRTKAG